MTDISVIKMIISVAVWRIYDKLSYINIVIYRWMTSCGRGRDSATRECFGRGSQGTIFVRSSKLSLFFPELCPFRRVFLFPALLKIWRQTFKLWGFWFRRCLWGLFENSAPSPGIFLPTPTTWTTTTSIFFENFLSFFQKRAGGTCLTAM